MAETKNFVLQLKRNSTPLDTKSAAVEALKTALSASTAKAGEPMIAIYTEDDVEKVLFGIVSSNGKYTIFEGANLKEDGTIEIPEAVKKAIEDAIASAKSSLLGDAGSDYNTLGKLEDKIQEEASRADTAEKALGTRIDNLDLTAVGGTGKVITTVSQTDGLVSATAADLTSSDKTVSVNGLDLKVNVDNSTIKVNSGTGALYVDPAATSVSGKDAVKVSDIETGKQVELVIATANKVLTQTTAGLDTTLGLKFVKASDNTADGTYKGKPVIQLVGVGDAVLGEFDATDLVMDGVLDKVELKDGKLTFTWNTDADKEATEIDLADYIKPYSAGNGLDLTGQVFSVKVKTDDKYLTVDANGVASKGIDEAITTAIEGLDADVTSTGGSKVTVKVVEEDGKVKTITVTESDIASDAALSAEIAARKAVDGQNGQTYAANTSSNYINEATSLNDADVKLDAQIKANADKISALEGKVGDNSVDGQIAAKLDELDLSQVGGSGKVITTISQSNGQVSATATDLTATNVAATAVGEGSATNVQGILTELHTEIEGVKSAAISLKAGNGISVTGEGTEKTIAALVKSDDNYIQVTADGIASKGIDAAISSAITDKVAELKVEDTVDNAKYVSGVSETDGKITVTRQNILADAQESVANALQLVNGSVYLSTVIDCGTY